MTRKDAKRTPLMYNTGNSSRCITTLVCRCWETQSMLCQAKDHGHLFYFDVPGQMGHWLCLGSSLALKRSVSWGEKPGDEEAQLVLEPLWPEPWIDHPQLSEDTGHDLAIWGVQVLVLRSKGQRPRVQWGLSCCSTDSVRCSLMVTQRLSIPEGCPMGSRGAIEPVKQIQSADWMPPRGWLVGRHFGWTACWWPQGKYRH